MTMTLCRICLKTSEDLLNLFDYMGPEKYSFDNGCRVPSSSTLLASKMVKVIEQHFWFKLRPNDKISRFICKCCWMKIDEFNHFYHTIRRAQENLMRTKDIGGANKNDTTEIKEEPLDTEVLQKKADVENGSNVTIVSLDSLQNIELHLQEVSLAIIDEEDERDRQQEHMNIEDETKETEIDISSHQNPLIEHEIDFSVCKAELLQEKSFLEIGSDSNDDENVLLTDLLHSSNNNENNNILEIQESQLLEKVKQNRQCKRLLRLRNKPLKRKRSMEEKQCHLKLLTSTSASITTPTIDENRRKKPRVKHDSQFIRNLIQKHIQMTCNLCTFVGETFKDIVQHFTELHSLEKPYIICCKRKLNKPYLITQHALKHENPDYFRCHKCEKSFVDDSSLRAHNMYHHAAEEEKIHVCEFCSQRFARKLLLELHKATHIPQEDRTIVCQQCPTKKTFATEYLLRIHNSMRHKREANVCHICAKKIRDKRCFEKHVRQHSENNETKSLRMKCTYPGCDSWLKDEDTLKQHMRRHNPDQKSYDCPECGKFCKNRRALTNHKRSSHSNQTFKCDECAKTFKKALSLREHMARHTGEALYKCPFCTRTFNSNANMHSHKKKMHPMEWEQWRKYQRGSAQILICNSNSSNNHNLTSMQTFYGSKEANLSLPTATTANILDNKEQ